MPGPEPHPGPAVTIRAASYNVHACIGRDGAFRPDRIADVIRSLDADVVGLQEVENRAADDSTIADYLAAELQMHVYHGPTLKRGEHAYGNLLLSRTEAVRVGRHDLTVLGREPRGIIDAVFDFNGVRCRTIVTHLGLAAHERYRQLEKLLAVIDAAPADAALLLADFNEWRPGSRLHRSLRSAFGRAPGPRTFPAWRPILPLDRVYASPGVTIEHSEAIRSAETAAASDHLPVVATCRIRADGDRHVPG